jgi:phosphatidylserine/phosphatidylglycerophosphate/cardiolipin synthase-like enzyme
LFVNGIDAQRAMVGAIERATRPADFVYLLGWWLSLDYVLDPASPTPRTLQDVLTAISPPGGGGSEIRAIVWRNKALDPASLGALRKLAIPPSLFQNVAQVDAINDPSKVGNGAAILDNRTKIFGSHHQKVLIVSNQDGLTAFCGGVDFNPDRVYAKGALPAVTAEGTPLHDVQLQIRGPAAVDLLEVFRERWFTHPDRLRLRPPTAPVPPRVPGPGRQTVQVLRTYGKSYPYPRSVRTAQATLVRAIAAARQHVYLEDQYFVGTDPGGMQIHDALLGALASIQQLIILITDTEISDMPQVGFRRRILISSLRAEAARLGKKFGVYRRIDPATGTAFGRETYVHAKLFIVDDELACVGSVNSGRRSYTYDSEAHVAVHDAPEPDGSRFARRLRAALWAKHLNLSAGDPRLADPIAAAALWDPPGLPAGARVAPFDENLNATLAAISPPTPADEADIDRLFKFVPLGLPGLPFPPGFPGFPSGIPGIPVGPLMVKTAWRAAAGASGLAPRVLYDYFWNTVVDPLGPP